MPVIVITIGATFGAMWRNIILMPLAPDAYAATTYSRSRSEKAWPRTRRATPVQLITPKNMARVKGEGRKSTAPEISKISAGIDASVVRTQVTISSTRPL